MDIANAIQSGAAELMSRQQAAKMLHISVRFLDDLISERKIGCYRVGTRVLLSPRQISQFQASAEVAPAGQERSPQGGKVSDAQ